MPFEPVTRTYAADRRKRAYGNTVYRCDRCGFEAWGRPTTLHALHCEGSFKSLDDLVIDPKPPKQYKPKA